MRAISGARPEPAQAQWQAIARLASRLAGGARAQLRLWPGSLTVSFGPDPLLAGEPAFARRLARAGAPPVLSAPLASDDGAAAGWACGVRSAFAEGDIRAVLWVAARRARPFASTLAGDLADLARLAMRVAAAARDRDLLADADAVTSQNLEAFVGAAPIAASVTDRDLRFVHVNKAWEREFKNSADKVIGRSLYELDRNAESWRLAFDNCLAGAVSISERVPIRRADGSKGFFSSGTAPWRSASGEVGGLVLLSCAGGGIETGESEQMVERLDAAIEMSGLYVWEMDHGAQRAWAVGASDTFFQGSVGYAELKDDTWVVVHPDDRARVVALWNQHAAEGTPFRAEYRLNRPDKEVWVAASGRSYRGPSGDMERWLGVLQDITARKRAELAAEAANEAKSRFLATMSHEIRTPLNGLLGMAQAMAADELAPKQRDRLEVIHRSGEALLTILNDILDLSKIEAGKLELESIPFDLEELAQGVHAAFAVLAERAGVALRVDLEGAAGTYMGDPTRLRQILSNLVSNALKFTAAGEVRIRGRPTRAGLRLDVADTGIGIAAEKLAGLFTSFAQVDSSTTRRFGGTGLGLAICRRLAELMGGRLEVESEPGSGSVFSLHAPLARIGGPSPARPPVRDAGPVWAAGEIRVLAAEDNPINQLVLETLLGQAGIAPTIVANGALAVEQWEQADWDVVLMDVEMPVMDGVAATAAIRAAEAAGGRARTPILALSANALTHQVAAYQAAGMDGHVSKPIEARRLFAAIEAAVTKSSHDRRAGTAAA